MERRSKLAVGGAAVGVAVVVTLTLVIVLPGAEPDRVLIPAGSYALDGKSPPGAGTYYWRQFTHEGRETAAYRVTGSWVATAPTQIFIAEELGFNFSGCGFLPLDVPPGAPAFGCWPAFAGSTGGSVDETFHICVGPGLLPTGSFVVIFRSQSPAVITLAEPFVVTETTFPQAGCPQTP